jgi:ribosomal protein S13
MARVASVRARRLEEERGLLLDAKKQFRMELKRNQGIGWYRSLQICKHLEMHERGKGPVITEATRDKITQIANMVKLGK